MLSEKIYLIEGLFTTIKTCHSDDELELNWEIIKKNEFFLLIENALSIL